MSKNDHGWKELRGHPPCYLKSFCIGLPVLTALCVGRKTRCHCLKCNRVLACVDESACLGFLPLRQDFVKATRLLLPPIKHLGIPIRIGVRFFYLTAALR